MFLQHFILTRFNLFLWQKDKEGCKVRTTKWLEHRFSLFEKYCLPSIKNQTCQDFEWIVLFDSMTPDSFKERITSYQKECSQMIPVFVKPENGRYFAEIFRRVVVKRLKAERVLTTYLDNDDALNIRFAEDIQQRALSLVDGTFIYYKDGYQFYTDYMYMMQIRYNRNHFVSVVENNDASTLKTIYGYGSHYYIDTIKGARIEYVESQPMWCEIVHEKNIGNDAYFLWAKMIKDTGRLRNNFDVDEDVKFGIRIYVFHFIPRYLKTFVRRTKDFCKRKFLI